MKTSANLSFQLMWSVEQLHVSHMILIRRMSKTMSDQPTAELHVSYLPWTKSTKNSGHALLVIS